MRNEADETKGGDTVRHCNSVFSADDIWFLQDKENFIKRSLYVANCPICNKRIALYVCFDESKKEWYEKYFYSGGADKIKQKLKKDVLYTKLGFKDKYKAPWGFKYGENKEIKRNGKIIAIKQYSCDFYGNKIPVKIIHNEYRK